VGISLLAGAFLLPFFAVFPVLFRVLAWLVGASLAVYVLAAVVRCALVFFYFLSYSLGQMIKVVFVAGLLFSSGMALPSPWCAIPYSALGLFALVIIAYVLSYDPVAKGKFIPPTAREALFNPPARRYPRPGVVQAKRHEHADLVAEIELGMSGAKKPYSVDVK